MSVLKPDLLKKFGQSEYFQVREAPTLVEKNEEAPISITRPILKENIMEFSRSLSDVDRDNFSYGRLASRICPNNRDSNYYLANFNTFFLMSLRKTYPDKNFDVLEDSFRLHEKELANLIKDDRLNNEVFIPCLLGMIEGLL